MTILTVFILVVLLVVLESVSWTPAVKRGLGIGITCVIVYFVLALLGLVPVIH